MSRHAPQGYYADSTDASTPYPRLTGDVHADACIIGGGYTGLSAALHLAQAGAKVALVEAETLGFAASGRNGGQIHPGYRQTQAELERWLGHQHARDLWVLSEEARHLVFKLAENGCELRHGLVVAAHDDSAGKELAVDTQYLKDKYRYGEARMLDRAESRSALGTALYATARFDMGGGRLHPLKYVHSLAAAAGRSGATIYEHSPAHAIEGDTTCRVRCAQGSVVADQVILACDAFSAALAPRLAPYIAHVESFIVATARLDEGLRQKIVPCDAAVADTRHVLDYYRKSADGRLLFAGREAYWSPPHDIAKLVRPRMLKVFPELEGVAIEYGWSGTVGITRTRMPHFGRLGPRTAFAHGYSGHGVALATLGGKALAEAVLGHSERFDILARVPPRKFPGGSWLRKPMVATALLTLKFLDSI